MRFVYDCEMLASISEIAKQIGLRPSAIRYYERIGVLLPAQRVSGQRRYDVTVLHRLAVIQRARQTGFTLEEVKELFSGFRAGTPPSIRWQELKKRKIRELDAILEHVNSMRALVRKQGNCRCTALEECGKKIFEKEYEERQHRNNGRDDGLRSPVAQLKKEGNSQRAVTCSSITGVSRRS